VVLPVEQIVVQKAMQTAEPVVEYSVIMGVLTGEHKVVLNTVPTFVQDIVHIIVLSIVQDIVD
jgi:hypothetical protein